MDDLLQGKMDDVLYEPVRAIGGGIGEALVGIGAVVVLGIIVMVFFLILVVKRKTNDSSGAATRSISTATSIAGISKKLVLFFRVGLFPGLLHAVW